MRLIPFLFTNLMILFSFMVTSCSSEDNEALPDRSSENPEENMETPEMESQFVPCVDGMAGIYPCKDYDLMSHLSVFELTGTNSSTVSDLWGWRDPETGKEYAIVGTSGLISFVDISDPERPYVAGRLDSGVAPTSHRDIKVYKDHAYIIGEADFHGMQVFDLKDLRKITNPPENLSAETTYKEFGHAHNLAINEDSGYAYILGSDLYEGGPHFVDIQDPKNPKAAGGFVSDSASHDAQVVTYSGPDTDYSGRELFIGSQGGYLLVLDVTSKEEPNIISTTNYENLGYVHQGWFTEDERYFIVGDEFDELEFSNNTRTLIFDFTDLDDPQLHFEYFGPELAIDHNGYTHNGMFYLANYTAGLRVIDISNIDNKDFEEVGYFDTYSLDNSTDFGGAWSVYPYFPSGNIAISDITGGLFIVRKNN